jgi:hypothetical protein
MKLLSGRLSKITGLAVVAGAIVMGTAAAASASTTTATNVSKGDVQTVLGWNDAAVQTKTPTFTYSDTLVVNFPWTAQNGAAHTTVETVVTTDALTATPVVQQSNGKIMGWTVSGPNKQLSQTITYTVDGGPVHPWSDGTQFTADGGPWTTGDAWGTMTDTTGTQLFVNGIALPSTDAVPAV